MGNANVPARETAILKEERKAKLPKWIRFRRKSPPPPLLQANLAPFPMIRQTTGGTGNSNYSAEDAFLREVGEYPNSTHSTSQRPASAAPKSAGRTDRLIPLVEWRSRIAPEVHAITADLRSHMTRYALGEDIDDTTHENHALAIERLLNELHMIRANAEDVFLESTEMSSTEAVV